VVVGSIPTASFRGDIMPAAFCVGCSFMTRDASFGNGEFGHWHKTPVGNHCPACVAAFEVKELPFEPSWLGFRDSQGHIRADINEYFSPAEPRKEPIRRCDMYLRDAPAKHFGIEPERITAIDIRAWRADNKEPQTMCIVFRRVHAGVSS
jgi:hypothetical protein